MPAPVQPSVRHPRRVTDKWCTQPWGFGGAPGPVTWAGRRSARADLAEHSLQTGLEIAQRAVQVDEEEPQAHFVVGVALLWSRKHDRALAELQRSVAMLREFGFLKNDVDVKQFTDLSIVQEAAQRLK